MTINYENEILSLHLYKYKNIIFSFLEFLITSQRFLKEAILSLTNI